MTDLTIVIDAWSALASTVAAYIAWRVYKWQRTDEVPVVLCEQRNSDGPSAWITFVITVRNTTNAKWKAKEIRVKKPRRAVGFSEWKGPTINEPLGGVRPDFDAAQIEASNPFMLGLFVDPVGSPRSAHYQSGDVCRETIHILKSSISGKKLTMELTIFSQEASSKTTRILIKRSIQ